MRWSQWQATWSRIAQEFQYSVDADRQAAHLLLQHARRLRPLHAATGRLRAREVTVLGCGPSLGRIEVEALGHGALVAADGASTRLMELGRVPDVVVTDLDGDPRGLHWAAASGATLVVHAHGDNQRALRELLPLLETEALCGTHQCPPEPDLAPLENIGGFTDGDRAVLLCEEAGAQAVRLVAWEPEGTPGPYSHRFDARTKAAKLGWAQRIVDDAMQRGLRVTRGP